MNYVIFTDEYVEDDEEFEDFYTGAMRNTTKFGDVNRDGHIYTTSLQNLDVRVASQGFYVRNSLKSLAGTIQGSKLLFFMELGFGINGIYGKTILDLTNYALVDKKHFIRKACNYVDQNIKTLNSMLQINQITKKLGRFHIELHKYYLNLLNKKEIIKNAVTLSSWGSLNKVKK